MMNGTTYIVRPLIDPSNSSRNLWYASRSCHQLFVTPARVFAGRADERQLLAAGHVVRGCSGAGNSRGSFSWFSSTNTPSSMPVRKELLLLLVRAVAPDDLVGPAQAHRLGDELARVRVRRRTRLQRRDDGRIGSGRIRLRGLERRHRKGSSAAAGRNTADRQGCQTGVADGGGGRGLTRRAAHCHSKRRDAPTRRDTRAPPPFGPCGIVGPDVQ